MVQNSVMEVRKPDNTLVAATVYDDAGNGLKLNYYYYEPGMPAGRSLGTYMILKCIEEARKSGKDYVYLSALTEEPSKISYKARFQPLETLRNGQWSAYNPAP
jgi:leucyl-tRNA---protein transferase